LKHEQTKAQCNEQANETSGAGTLVLLSHRYDSGEEEEAKP
jgi:hypothetical protein